MPESKGRYHVYIHRDPFFGWVGLGGSVTYAPHLEHPDLYDSGLEEGFIPSFGNEFAYATSCLKQMLPGIKPKLSLPNTLYELKDMRSLGRTLSRVLSFFRPSGKKSKWTLAKLLDAGVDVFLQKEFNVDPLISDLNGLYRSVSSAEKELSSLLRDIGKPQRRHSGKSWVCIPEQPEVMHIIERSGDAFPLACLCQSFSKVGPAYAKLHCEIEYTYSIPDLQAEHARLLALLDSLGVNLNPAIIWNAIPWSFVIDWVVNVSSFLNRFAIRNIEPIVHIHRFLYSVKVTRSTQAYLTVGMNGHKMPYTIRRSMPTVVEEAYKRVAQSPEASSIVMSGLDPREFSLGAALAYSVGRRRYRKVVAIRLQK